MLLLINEVCMPGPTGSSPLFVIDIVPEMGNRHFNTKCIIAPQKIKSDREEFNRATIYVLEEGFLDYITNIVIALFGSKNFRGNFKEISNNFCEFDKATTIEELKKNFTSNRIKNYKNYSDLIRELPPHSNAIPPVELPEPPAVEPPPAAPVLDTAKKVDQLTTDQLLTLLNHPQRRLSKDELNKQITEELATCRTNLAQYKEQLQSLEGEACPLFESRLTLETYGRLVPMQKFIEEYQNQIDRCTTHGYESFWSWVEVPLNEMTAEILAEHLKRISSFNDKIKAKIKNLNTIKASREVLREKIDKEVNGFLTILTDYKTWVQDIEAHYDINCSVISNHSHLIQDIEQYCGVEYLTSNPIRLIPTSSWNPFKGLIKLKSKLEPLNTFFANQIDALTSLKDHQNLDPAGLNRRQKLVTSFITRLSNNLGFQLLQTYQFEQNQLIPNSYTSQQLTNHMTAHQEILILEGEINARITVFKEGELGHTLNAYKMEKEFKSLNLKSLQEKHKNYDLYQLLSHHKRDLQKLLDTYAYAEQNDLAQQIDKLPNDHPQQALIKETVKTNINDSIETATTQFTAEVANMAGHPCQALAQDLLTQFTTAATHTQSTVSHLPLRKTMVDNSIKTFTEKLAYLSKLQTKEVEANRLLDNSFAKITEAMQTLKEKDQFFYAYQLESMLIRAGEKRKTLFQNDTNRICLVGSLPGSLPLSLLGSLPLIGSIFASFSLTESIPLIGSLPLVRSLPLVEALPLVASILLLKNAPIEITTPWANSQEEKTIRRTSNIGSLIAMIESAITTNNASPELSLATQVKLISADSIAGDHLQRTKQELLVRYQINLREIMHKNQEEISASSQVLTATLQEYHDYSKKFLNSLLGTINANYSGKCLQPKEIGRQINTILDSLNNTMRVWNKFCFGWRRYPSYKDLLNLTPAQLFEHEQSVKAITDTSNQISTKQEQYHGLCREIRTKIDLLRSQNNWLAAFKLEKALATAIFQTPQRSFFSSFKLEVVYSTFENDVASGLKTLKQEDQRLEAIVKTLKGFASAPELKVFSPMEQLKEITKQGFPLDKEPFASDVQKLRNAIAHDLASRVPACTDTLKVYADKIRTMFGLEDSIREGLIRDIHELTITLLSFKTQFPIMRSLVPQFTEHLLDKCKAYARSPTEIVAMIGNVTYTVIHSVAYAWIDYNELTHEQFAASNPEKYINTFCDDIIKNFSAKRLIENYDQYQANVAMIEAKHDAIVQPAGHPPQFFYETQFAAEVEAARQEVAAWEFPGNNWLGIPKSVPNMSNTAPEFTLALDAANKKFDHIFKRTWKPLTVNEQFAKLDPNAPILNKTDPTLNAHLITSMTKNIPQEIANTEAHIELIKTIQRDTRIPVNDMYPVVDELNKLIDNLKTEEQKLILANAKTLKDIKTQGGKIAKALLELQKTTAKHALQRTKTAYEQYTANIARIRDIGKPANINPALPANLAHLNATLIEFTNTIMTAGVRALTPFTMEGLAKLFETTNRQIQAEELRRKRPVANGPADPKKQLESLTKYQTALTETEQALIKLIDWAGSQKEIGVDISGWGTLITRQLKKDENEAVLLIDELNCPEAFRPALKQNEPALNDRIEILTKKTGQGVNECYRIEERSPVNGLKTAVEAFEKQRNEAKDKVNADLDAISKTQAKLVKQAFENLQRPTDAKDCLHTIKKATYLIKAACDAVDDGNTVANGDPWVNAFNAPAGNVPAADVAKIFRGFTLAPDSKAGVNSQYRKSDGILPNIDAMITWYAANLNPLELIAPPPPPLLPPAIYIAAEQQRRQARLTMAVESVNDTYQELILLQDNFATANDNVAQAEAAFILAAPAAIPAALINLEIAKHGLKLASDALNPQLTAFHNAKIEYEKAYTEGFGLAPAALVFPVAPPPALLLAPVPVVPAPAVIPAVPAGVAAIPAVDPARTKADTAYRKLNRLRGEIAPLLNAPMALIILQAHQKSAQEACSEMRRVMRGFMKTHPITDAGVQGYYPAPTIKWW